MFKPTKPQHIATKAYSDSTVTLELKQTEESNLYIENSVVQEIMKKLPKTLIIPVAQNNKVFHLYSYGSDGFKYSAAGVQNVNDSVVFLGDRIEMYFHSLGFNSYFYHDPSNNIWVQGEEPHDDGEVGSGGK